MITKEQLEAIVMAIDSELNGSGDVARWCTDRGLNPLDFGSFITDQSIHLLETMDDATELRRLQLAGHAGFMIGWLAHEVYGSRVREANDAA